MYAGVDKCEIGPGVGIGRVEAQAAVVCDDGAAEVAVAVICVAEVVVQVG